MTPELVNRLNLLESVLGAVNLGFIYARTVYEERVLERAHPQYAAYRAKTARFIPGVF